MIIKEVRTVLKVELPKGRYITIESLANLSLGGGDGRLFTTKNFFGLFGDTQSLDNPVPVVSALPEILA